MIEGAPIISGGDQSREMRLTEEAPAVIEVEPTPLDPAPIEFPSEPTDDSPFDDLQVDDEESAVDENSGSPIADDESVDEDLPGDEGSPNDDPFGG